MCCDDLDFSDQIQNHNQKSFNPPNISHQTYDTKRFHRGQLEKSHNFDCKIIFKFNSFNEGFLYENELNGDLLFEVIWTDNKNENKNGDTKLSDDDLMQFWQN